MVGGVIIGITKPVAGTRTDHIHVNVADCPHYPKHPRGECPNPDTCCVYTDGVLIDKGDGSIADLQVGDSFWWHGGYCYWTPKNKLPPFPAETSTSGIDYDIRLKKIGYSH